MLSLVPLTSAEYFLSKYYLHMVNFAPQKDSEGSTAVALTKSSLRLQPRVPPEIRLCFSAAADPAQRQHFGGTFGYFFGSLWRMRGYGITGSKDTIENRP